MEREPKYFLLKIFKSLKRPALVFINLTVNQFWLKINLKTLIVSGLTEKNVEITLFWHEQQINPPSLQENKIGKETIFFRQKRQW
jgi:hypothetical protein